MFCSGEMGQRNPWMWGVLPHPSPAFPAVGHGFGDQPLGWGCWGGHAPNWTENHFSPCRSLPDTPADKHVSPG